MLALLTLFVSFPAILFFTCLLLGWVVKPPSVRYTKGIKKCAVLIPAHNEELLIGETVRHVLEEASDNCVLIVVADNCTDGTAEKAKSNGAVVLERFDNEQKGKGFALDFGVDYILKNLDVETVVIFDADCRFAKGAFNKLVHKSQSAGLVVQSQYLMKSPEVSSISLKIAELTWALKNDIRARGMRALGLGCHLQGSGMAFPIVTLKKQSLASSSIVEDLELGLTLALENSAALYFEPAKVYSFFPENKSGAESQRKRWEHGHMSIIKKAPSLLLRSLKSRNFVALLMVIDAAIPPTILWLLTLASLSFISLPLFLISHFTVLLLVPFLFVLTLALITGIWFTYGKEITSQIKLIDVAKFVVSKFSVYRSFFSKPETEWIRTERGQNESKSQKGTKGD